ncbi:hypothetical protein [Bacillus coahuilensis]|uniref:hypothetical protein n=1 Tax=Bacillus coahuilensis TaxID=408580 RepID=UPI0001851493|nr:hypothetical protein [Bacillus coahuilensis]
MQVLRHINLNNWLVNFYKFLSRYQGKSLDKMSSERKAALSSNLEEVERTGSIGVEDGKSKMENLPSSKLRITPTSKVNFLKNVHIQTDTFSVKNSDEIEVRETEGGVTKEEWEIKLNDDFTEAILEIVPSIKYIQHLEDHPKTKHLKPIVKEEKDYPDAELTEVQVINELNRLGVTYGIQYEKIRLALKN